MTPDPSSIFLVTAPGLEPVLADEARAAGFAVEGTVGGGVTLSGGWDEVARANLTLRGATRVLARVASFRAMHLAQLDKRLRRVDWSDWLRPSAIVRIDATCRKSRIYHAGAAAQRLRGALEAAGFIVAPNTGTTLKLRLDDDLATVSIDTSGASLHKRGFKPRVNKAPMRETLASLFLRAVEFNQTKPLLDPFCGSGTFVMEAAEMAAGLLPGRRRSFDFENLVPFSEWRRPEMNAIAEGAPLFHGSDRDAGAIAMSRENAEVAGVSPLCSFKTAAIDAVVPPDGPPGLVIANPPYGGRIGRADWLPQLYRAFGGVMKERFKGWRVALVTSDRRLARATGLDWQPPGPIVDHGGTKIRLWRTGPI